MDQKPLFYEKQKFNQRWLWTILVLVNVAGVYALYKEYQKGTLAWEFFVGHLVFILIFISLFYFMSLETTITKDEIAIKYFPFHLKQRTYPFTALKHLEVVKYNPISDYGGWGVRLSRNGKAFNVKGEFGLKLYFDNRKPLLIGTQKPEELKKILESLEVLKQQS
jgi:hypothetical protein